MVDDMENLKVKVNNEAESKEAQELFFDLGYGWHGKGKVVSYLNETISDYFGWLVLWKPPYLTNTVIQMGSGFEDCKEVTLQNLKHLVILKRNSIDDATHYYGGSKYYLTDSEFYQYSEGKWVNIDEYVDGMTFKKIGKELKVKMKEYLDTNYELRSVKQTSGDNLVPSSWIEVPEGAEILYFDKRYEPSNHFFKTVNGKSYYKYLKNGSKWMEYSDDGLNEFKDNIENFRTMWQRNQTTPNTLIQDKLKFIEKWLNGEKIQYILGIESDKTQTDESKWHNFTDGAMQYIKRPDIKFRLAPKYVTINGIEFNGVEKLMNYVKNNFDLEDGE